MMKRLSLILAVMMLTAVLAISGCGGSGGSGSGQSSSTPAPAPAKEETVADLFGKAKKIEGMSFDMIMTAQGVPQITAKTAMQGKKIRTEMTIKDQKMISIMDGDAKVAYTYMPDQKMAMKVNLDKAKKMETPDSFLKDSEAPKYKVLETTTLDGVPCKVMQLEDPQSKVQTKMWVRLDYGFPAKVETTVDGKTHVIEYKNLKVGPQPADLFQLPAGVKVVDMGQMPQGGVPDTDDE